MDEAIEQADIQPYSAFIEPEPEEQSAAVELEQAIEPAASAPSFADLSMR